MTREVSVSITISSTARNSTKNARADLGTTFTEHLADIAVSFARKSHRVDIFGRRARAEGLSFHKKLKKTVGEARARRKKTHRHVQNVNAS